MSDALSQLVGSLWDVTKPPGAYWTPPFQPCTPSDPAVLSLQLEPVKASPEDYQTPTVRVTARNLTPDPLPFLVGDSVTESFSAIVLDPSGKRAKIPLSHQCLYGPCSREARALHSPIEVGNGTFFRAVPPKGELSWKWPVGLYFDMSAPGVYRVSLGGRNWFVGRHHLLQYRRRDRDKISEMLYLTEQDVRDLLPMNECIKMMRLAFEALAHGKAQNQPRRRLILEETGSVLHSMAGAFGKYFGTKFYSTNAKFGAHFLFALYDARTATPLALMEANHLGQIRTGAASGYATDLMAHPEASVLGIIGSGFQAKTQLDAIRAVRPIKTVRVWSRDAAKRQKFAEEHGVTATDTAEEAVRGAQIVATATNAKDPVIEDQWIADGTHINAMGSNIANRRELPAALVKRAGLVAVDSLEQAKIEAGDLILADSWANVVELQNVKKEYHADRVTIFKSIGLGVEDVAAAAFIYERALATPEVFAGRNLAKR